MATKKYNPTLTKSLVNNNSIQINKKILIIYPLYI